MGISLADMPEDGTFSVVSYGVVLFEFCWWSPFGVGERGFMVMAHDGRHPLRTSSSRDEPSS